ATPARAPAAPRAPAPPDLSALLELLRAGRHAELESGVRARLATQRDNGVLWKLLGAALLKQGQDPLEAVEAEAGLLPADAEAQSNLGNMLRARGRLEEAAEAQRRALRVDPGYAEAHNNLGSVQRDLGQLEAAAASYGRATLLKPELAMAHHN